GEPERDGSRRRGLFDALQGELSAEVARLSALAAGSLGVGATGGQGLAAVGLAIRTAMTKLGASLLKGLLATDTGHRGPHLGCVAGHQARFVSYRTKTLDTVLGPVECRRAYYHPQRLPIRGGAPRRGAGGGPHASLSGGLRAMVARLGAAAPFAKARDLLAELTGVELSGQTGGTVRRSRRQGRSRRPATPRQPRSSPKSWRHWARPPRSPSSTWRWTAPGVKTDNLTVVHWLSSPSSTWR
ncbi:MAG: hypothetical protein ACYDDU_20360, partial [Dermatophilaceae bacterium]